jgi:hypothetical protein
MKTDARNWLRGYGIMGAITFLFQIWVRLGQCEGVANCAVSFAKAVV